MNSAGKRTTGGEDASARGKSSPFSKGVCNVPRKPAMRALTHKARAATVHRKLYRSNHSSPRRAYTKTA
jgi:hypothetical protein